MIQNCHFRIEQYYEFILLHEWHLLFPWQGLGTNNAMLDPIFLCLAICWHSLSNYCYSFTWRKKPIKTMYWFHTNKLKKRKSFFIHILTFWDTKVYIYGHCATYLTTKTTANTMQMTRKMTAVTEAMITMVWEFMLTAVLLGGRAWVVLEGGKQPAATENTEREINICI